MPVRRLRLADFSAFKSADLEFVDGLNILLGANGTGKTHILKVIYSLLEATRTDTLLRDKLAGVFRRGLIRGGEERTGTGGEQSRYEGAGEGFHGRTVDDLARESIR